MTSKQKNLVIVCLSNQFYNLPLKTNKHLVMDELVSRGYKVLFVDPPTRFAGLKKLIYKKSLITKKQENYYIYTPINLLNFFPFSWISNKIHLFLIKKTLKKLKTDKCKLVLWTYHFDFPRIFDIQKNINPDVFIYDVVDNYASFPEYSNRDISYKKYNLFVHTIEKVDRFFKELIDQKGKKGSDWVKYRENELTEKVDLMFASHPLLYEEYKKITDKIVYTPNAGAFELYNKKPDKEPSELKEIKRPIVGYSGALDAYKFDVDLFCYTAINTPDINYVLIGPLQLSDSTENVQKLKNLSNIYLLGTKSFEDTAKFTHYFDSYIIPYQINDNTNYVFPVKFFNALATGVPVVVTNMSAYKGFEHVLYISKNKEEFLENVKKSVKDKSKNKREERISVAKQNTWKKKVNKQIRAINDYLSSI